MSMEFRYPNITAPTEAGQLAQMRSYLHQMVGQLNWALNSIESGNGYQSATARTAESTAASTEKETLSTFNNIKALIIKSADIVNAYYEKINARLEGQYVAESDFGTYTELTESQIEANSTRIEQLYTNLQEIITDIETLEHSLIETNAYINSGLLYYDDEGVPVYGLEVGQRTEIDGEEVFNKYARFTAARLSFYDSNGYEVAYVSYRKLFIPHAEITSTLTCGGLVDTVLPDGSVVTK